MAAGNFDEDLGKICKKLVCIDAFLDAVFGYLCRCTDFYVTSAESGKGEAAKELTIQMFDKWQRQARLQEQLLLSCDDRLQSDGVAPAAIREEEVLSDTVAEETSDTSGILSTTSCDNSGASQCLQKLRLDDSQVQSAQCSGANQPDPRYYAADSKCYNGAVRDNYCWAQSITDLDILVPVRSSVLKGRQVNVQVSTARLEVRVQHDGSWLTLLDGHLCWTVNPALSLWSLEPGRQIQIHLEKTEERWWDAVLTTEPKIDLTGIDASRPLEDFGEDVEMKLQEMMWNEKRKKEGLPTSDQQAHARILKDAWNLEGSPFAGTPYDPSVLL